MKENHLSNFLLLFCTATVEIVRLCTTIREYNTILQGQDCLVIKKSSLIYLPVQNNIV